MIKLLSANFSRLIKDKVFWIGIAVMLAVGILLPVMGYADARRYGYVANIDGRFFTCSMFVGVIVAIFCSLYIGTEYSDGTIRNKIVIGHKRYSIYLANFITVATVGVAMCAAYFIAHLCLGLPLLGAFVSDAKTVVLFVLVVLLFTCAFSSIFVCVSMLCSNKAVSAIVCVLFAVAIVLIGLMLNGMLEAPRTVSSYVMGEDGVPVIAEIPNPKYLDGAMRAFVQTVYDILPGGQVMQCLLLKAANLELLPVYSLIIAGLTTGAGVFFFQRKELK